MFICICIRLSSLYVYRSPGRPRTLRRTASGSWTAAFSAGGVGVAWAKDSVEEPGARITPRSIQARTGRTRDQEKVAIMANILSVRRNEGMNLSIVTGFRICVKIAILTGQP